MTPINDRTLTTRKLHRDGPVILRPDLLQRLQLGQVIEDDIGLGGIMDQVILVIALGRVKALERLNLGDDGA